MIKPGWSVVYIEGVTDYSFKKKILYLKMDIVLKKNADLMKCQNMRHFIRVYTVC